MADEQLRERLGECLKWSDLRDFARVTRCVDGLIEAYDRDPSADMTVADWTEDVAGVLGWSVFPLGLLVSLLHRLALRSHVPPTLLSVCLQQLLAQRRQRNHLATLKDKTLVAAIVSGVETASEEELQVYSELCQVLKRVNDNKPVDTDRRDWIVLLRRVLLQCPRAVSTSVAQEYLMHVLTLFAFDEQEFLAVLDVLRRVSDAVFASLCSNADLPAFDFFDGSHWHRLARMTGDKLCHVETLVRFYELRRFARPNLALPALEMAYLHNDHISPEMCAYMLEHCVASDGETLLYRWHLPPFVSFSYGKSLAAAFTPEIAEDLWKRGALLPSRSVYSRWQDCGASGIDFYQWFHDKPSQWQTRILSVLLLFEYSAALSNSTGPKLSIRHACHSCEPSDVALSQGTVSVLFYTWLQHLALSTARTGTERLLQLIRERPVTVRLTVQHGVHEITMSQHELVERALRPRIADYKNAFINTDAFFGDCVTTVSPDARTVVCDFLGDEAWFLHLCHTEELIRCLNDAVRRVVVKLEQRCRSITARHSANTAVTD